MDVNHRDVEGNTPLYVSSVYLVSLHVIGKSWYTCITTKEIKWTVHECYKLESRDIMHTHIYTCTCNIKYITSVPNLEHEIPWYCKDINGCMCC